MWYSPRPFFHTFDNILISAYFFRMKCALGERGQVTIPKAVRRELGLQPGMQLDVTVENGVVMLRRPSIDAALEVWESSIEIPGGRTDEFISTLRDES